MNVYVQGFSALAHYRSSNATLGVERCPASVRKLSGATSSRREIAGMSIWRLGIESPSTDRPLEVLVRTGSERSRSKAVSARVWKGPIAPTAFRQVTSNIYVSSPEFVFLQLATRLGLPELVALGMELCGTYRRNVEVASLGTQSPCYITDYHQPPLSTPKRLRGFLNTMSSAPGAPQALKALDYVLPNSASPMETALYLLLCLPRRLGGYALPKPSLNPLIVLSKAGRRHTLRSSAKPDLYWRDAMLDLEFNSDEFHDETTRTNDSMRRKALERMHVEVIELTTSELFDEGLLHATALRIALRLGKQLRPEGEGTFIEKRALLREALLESRQPDNDGRVRNGSIKRSASPDEEPWTADDEQLFWADDPAQWMQGALDEDAWADDLMRSDGIWTADIMDPDIGDQYASEDADWELDPA